VYKILQKEHEMDPITLTLLGYPLSILANLTYDQLKKVSAKTKVNPLKDLFVAAFFKSLDYHDKGYDAYSKERVEILRKAVKKDKTQLLNIFSRHSNNFNTFLSAVRTRELQELLAKEIFDEYKLDLGDYPDLMIGIVTDCLSFYMYAFFNQMNEKQGIQAILLECLKLDNIAQILTKIDSQVVTKNDFDELRKSILLKHFNENNEARKNLNDYDQYLKHKFKYIELRGFSPRISGKEVQMELIDVFVPLEITADKTIVPNIFQGNIPLQRQALKDDNISRTAKKKDPITSILEKRSLVILGDPGSGKSTLLKYLTIQISNLRTNIDALAHIIPVYFRISDYADYFKETKRSIYEFLTKHYDIQYQHIFKENFEHSNLLLLMDGLDEITDTPLRIRVTEQVMDLLARYPYNRYVVTSRIVGYQ
jgi:hypothetical protein